jgi:transporter family-2 protein
LARNGIDQVTIREAELYVSREIEDGEALMRSYVLLAAWTFLAGAGIPLIGVLSSGMARSVGNPLTPTAIMFTVATVVAAVPALPLFGLPTTAQLASAPPASYAPGLIIGFYALSATIIIPRFGAASFVAFILIAQLLTSAVVDQFGLFSMVRRPIDLTKLIGLSVIVAGIAIMEIGNLQKAHS